MGFKTIKYKPKDQQMFFTSLKKRVKDHFGEKVSSKGNWKMYLKSVLQMAGYFIPFVILLTYDNMSTWMFYSIWAIMGIFMAGIGLSIQHDANHGAYSSNRTINSILGALINFVGGSAHNWKIQHNILHHTYTNITGHDEDIHPVGILRFSPNEKLKGIHRFQHLYAWFFYGLMTIQWLTTKDFRGLKRYNDMGFVKTGYKKEFIKLVFWKIIYLGYVLALPMIFVDNFSFIEIIVGFLSMHFIAGLILGLIFQPAHVMETSEFPMPNQDMTIENTWAVHQMNNTANFGNKNFFLNWYAGGLNFQIEHHLFPNICHIHYKKISKIVKQTAKEYGIPYNELPSFTSAVWNHAKMLRKLGLS